MDHGLLYSLSGLAIGILVGMTGVGGGSLMTPLLILIFGVAPTTAVGTDLLYACLTKSVGTAVHGWKQSVDWAIVGRLAAGSIPATVVALGLLWSLSIDTGQSTQLVTKILGLALLLTAIALVFRRQILAAYSRRGIKLDAGSTRGLTILTGAILGVLVSLTSVGAGALGVTALIMLYPTMPAARIAGSDIAHAVPLTLVAGFGHWLLGSIDFGLLGALLLGSIPGVIIGSLLSSRVPDRALRLILAVTLFAVSIKLLA